jgi:L-asparaginase II
MDLIVEQKRGDTVESTHRVSVAVVSNDGTLRAHAGNPDLVTFMRSAAKPIQVMTFLESGASGHVEITSEELALACASHNSEVDQVAIASGFLKKLELTEDDLACGPHRSLFYELGRYHGPGKEKPALVEPSAIASNCSGKHSAMLAFARQKGWDPVGYEKPEHPVQKALLAEISGWTDVGQADVAVATDGCGVVTFAVPLRNMALAYSRLVTLKTAHATEVVNAMVSHPQVIAGSHRLCTALMMAYPGEIIAKVGAGGVYMAGLVKEGLGIALKAEDGDGRAVEVALLAVLEDLGLDPVPSELLPFFSNQKHVSTRGEVVGGFAPNGKLEII